MMTFPLEWEKQKHVPNDQPNNLQPLPNDIELGMVNQCQSPAIQYIIMLLEHVYICVLHPWLERRPSSLGQCDTKNPL